jgi:transposase
MKLIDMDVALNLGKSSVKHLYKRYLTGEFTNLLAFKTAGQKKSESLKDISMESNIIATEISLNPCLGLYNLSDKLQNVNTTGHYSKSTVCRLVKKLDYSPKTPTLIPLGRKSPQNKLLRSQYTRVIDIISNDNLIFFDETGLNLHLNILLAIF